MSLLKNVAISVSALLAVSCSQSQDPRLSQIEDHSTAIHIKDGWIRDPYIILAPDNKYYLTGTTPNPEDPREESDKYNVGLGEESIVGSKLRVWRSDDLIDWETLDIPYTLEHTFEALGKNLDKAKNNVLWAPELHWMNGCWALVHCPKPYSTLAISGGAELDGKWSHPNATVFRGRHDPSLFMDDDGKWYLLYGNTYIAPINADFTDLEASPVRIDPSNRTIGHEGATLRKIEGKYVHFGTAWSTDKGRQGSYNLYYCYSDSVMGEYGERRFVGRFLGHGTPFQDKSGKWWCTAFFNGNVPPLSPDGIEERDLSDTAQSINEQGTTIVPLEVYINDKDELIIRAIDTRYRNPGVDEAQEFDRM